MTTFIQGFKEAILLIWSLDPTLLEIINHTLQVTLWALLFASVLGVPLGAMLGLTSFRGKGFVTTIIHTAMGLPPVFVGLVVYLLLSNRGVLGVLDWLFTRQGIVVAQTIIGFPIVMGLTMSSIQQVNHQYKTELLALGVNPFQLVLTMIQEAQKGIFVAIASGFGRIIAEVGAVMLVGGNIEGKTRVLTTAIVLETRQGRFDLALALGIILLGIAFCLHLVISGIQGRVATTLQ